MANDSKMSLTAWKNFYNDNKMFKNFGDNRYYCKCGHSVVMTEKTERKFCDWCHYWVYKDPKKQEEYDKQTKEKEEKLKGYKFRKELMKRL